MVAKKALRVNLSDLAAKGATPAGFLLALALPKPRARRGSSAFARGLGADADAYACPLLGGDSVRTPGPVTISITALRHAAAGHAWCRAAARGRAIASWSPGTIGDAALGLVLRESRRRGDALEARRAAGSAI